MDRRGFGDAPAGTQVVQRVGMLLRQVAASRSSGMRLNGLVANTGLTKPTVHRLLNSLGAEGLLDQDEKTGLWHLGPEMYVMGSAAASRFPIEEIAHPSLQRLAASTGESAFLSMRRRDETICLMREDGSFPIRSFVLAEGTRFPLGVGSAGLAILAHLDRAEQEEHLSRLDLSDGRHGVNQSLAAIRATIADAQTLGYVVNPGRIVEGSWGMAAAIFDRANRPMWALTLTGIESRFRPDRQKELGRALLLEAHHVSRRIATGAVD
ncbi:IclR family transcriptional regulator [Leifsonia sp. Leaf264]|uniref:IclR family transcriptional regulator n=1 Tax=Leifsonia sp. Leaf264 TaxID=1736314 RepID=UPI0006F3F9B8|nr:IclR family transcriptional regulator [Leifsonia sp. Leaf264]KQP01784.1 IclR family transcriptional regulator [Leifsonia sp. Leaf264]